jgi:hypothetical protein
MIYQASSFDLCYHGPKWINMIAHSCLLKVLFYVFVSAIIVS